MNDIIKKLMLILSLSVAIVCTSVLSVHAQSSTSTGRSNVVTHGNQANEYKAVVNMRELINEGEFDKAIIQANKLIKSEDRRGRMGGSKSEFYLEAYNGLCVSLTSLPKPEEAMEACNESLALSPNNWESLKSRATLHYMYQDFPKSLTDFEMSLENAPDNEAVTNVLKQNIGVVRSKIN